MRQQRRGRVVVRGLVVAAVLAAAAAQAREREMLRFGIDVKGTPVQVAPTDADDPKPLRFGSPSVRVEGRLLLAELVVENTAERPLRIVVNPYGGNFPYGGENPFTLRFASGAPVKYAGKLYPPEPPLPMVILFPAKTMILFGAELSLSHWSWSGEPEVELSWGFHLEKGGGPSGTLKVQLPRP